MEENALPSTAETLRKVFKVTAFPTIDPALEDRWERSIGIQAPRFQRVACVHPGQAFHLLVMFMGYGTDAHMHAKVDFSWKVLDAAGKKVMGASKLDGIKGRVLHGDFILRPRTGIELVFPQKAGPGKYMIEVQAHCHVSKHKADFRIEIELADFDWERRFASPEEVAEWMESYAQTPDPARLPDASRLLFETLGRTDPDTYFTALAFCGEVLRMNPWLGAEIETRWDAFSAAERSAVIFLFHAARRSSTVPALQNALQDRMKAPFPSAADLLSRPLTHPHEIDMVWALYRANGQFEAFRKVCKAIAPMPEAFQAVTDETIQEAVIKSAAWSIEQHLSKNADAMTYAMAIFKEHELDPRVYLFLEGILAKRGWIPNPDYML